MTDETRPTDPTDPAEARLRAALDAAATAAGPVTDDWADVLARADGTRLPSAEAAATGRDPRRRTRRAATFAVAAVLTLLVGTALVLATTTTDEDADTITAGPTRADEPTGWYVPSPLPAGWSVTDVTFTSTPWNCPCRSVTWGDEPTGRSLRYSRNPAVEPPDGAGVPPSREVDLGGVTGRLDDEDGPVPAVTWTEAGDRRVLVATEIGADELLAAARGLVGRPDPVDSPIEGLTVVAGSQVDTDQRVERAVVVTLRTAEDHPVSYSLTPRSGDATSWYGRFLTPVDPLELETGIDPVYDLVAGWPTTPEAAPPTGVPSAAEFVALPRYLARPPGAEVLLPSLGSPITTDGEATYDPTTVVADTDRLVRSLRPASTEAWAAFLASADQHDPALDGMALLADLADLDAVAPSAMPTTTTTEPTPTQPSPTTTTPGVPPTTEADPVGSTDPAIDASFEVDDEEVAPGDEVVVRITATNTSDRAVPISPCFPASLDWGIEQDGVAVGLGGGIAASCTSGTDELAPGETRTVTNGAAGSGIRLRTVDADGTNLAPGRYDAVVTVEGLDDRIVAPFRITG